ncbi:MAG: hypothetical protein JRE40_01735 [Deltaproteobacteria bacterium]|nr:hypothetical protein [Deltaproteobacteria bacterium]MBW2672507.1 hypothetical protein [Deltaproteobacteria bacterium]
MPRQIKRIETYTLSRHDLSDLLGVYVDRVISITKIEGNSELDDPAVEIVIEVSGEDD